MNSTSKILKFLYADEQAFVDEIDRVENSPDKVLLIPEDCFEQGGGWLFSYGEADSGDWNLARMIGQAEVAFRYANLLPKAEINLLFPENTGKDLLNGLILKSSLLFFADKKTGESKEISGNLFEKNQIKPFCQVKIRTLQGQAKPYEEGELDGVYLVAEEMVKAYVKVIRRSKKFNEVYIEVEPSMRLQGIGWNLLKMAILQCRKRKKTLIYAVDQDNPASVATAEKAELFHYQTLARAILTADGR